MTTNERPNTVDTIKENLSTLSSDERAEIAKHLFDTVDAATRLSLTAEGMRDLPRGRQNFEIFTELARIAVLPTYEAVTIRPNDEEESIDILLKQRKSENGNKDWWEGQWHVPGMVLSASDPYPEEYEDFSIVRNRLFSAELGDALRLTGAPQPLPPVLREGGRGKEVTVRELLPVEVKPDASLPENAKFFEIRNVLANPPGGGFVGTHEQLVQSIADRYINFYKSTS